MNTQSSLRLYQKIWNTIRDTGTCTIAVNEKDFMKVRQAVYKEKCMDNIFKLEVRGKKRLTVQYGKNSMTFSLKTTITEDML